MANGRTIFNGASTADHASISNSGGGESHTIGGQTIFNDTSTAANASIDNWGNRFGEVVDGLASTIFNDTSTAGHATITSHEGAYGGATIFKGSSTADSAILIANGGRYGYDPAVRLFLMVLRRVAPPGWKFLAMVTWTLAATNRV